MHLLNQELGDYEQITRRQVIAMFTKTEKKKTLKELGIKLPEQKTKKQMEFTFCKYPYLQNILEDENLMREIDENLKRLDELEQDAQAENVIKHNFNTKISGYLISKTY